MMKRVTDFPQIQQENKEAVTGEPYKTMWKHEGEEATETRKRWFLGGFWNWRKREKKPQEKSKACLLEHWKTRNGVSECLVCWSSLFLWFQGLVVLHGCRQCVKGPFCLYCFVALHSHLSGAWNLWEGLPFWKENLSISLSKFVPFSLYNFF